jgi:TRAP-type C4-dicarboxylate transport system permease small subunit
MLNRTLETIVAFLMMLTVTIGFAAVVARYGFGRSFSWSFEALQALLVYMTFISAFLALRKGAHLRIDVLFNKLPTNAQIAVHILNQLTIVGVGAVMTFWGYQQAIRFFWRKSLVMEFSLGFLYLIVPLCGAAFVLHALGTLPRGVSRIRQGLPPEPNADPFAAEGQTSASDGGRS